MIELQGTLADVDDIFSPLTIRNKCKQIFVLALEGKTHFKLNLEKIDEVVQFICEVTLNNYPTLNIPRSSANNLNERRL